MTDIATTLAQAKAKLAAWQAEAATAAASGAAQAQTADAAWDAVAAIEAATAHAEGLRGRHQHRRRHWLDRLRPTPRSRCSLTARPTMAGCAGSS